MPLDILRALQLGQFVDAAYNPIAGPPAGYPVPLGYQLVDVLYGNDLATDIGGLKATVPFGFIARSPAPAADFIVAIRGTDSIWEWLQDARFLRIACPFIAGAGETEDGFSDVYMSMTSGTPAGPRVVARLASLLSGVAGATLTITGHSLGSALATLLALDVAENTPLAAPAVVTFASPLVGDTQFARIYNVEVPNSWRIANFVDLIPRMPPSFWGYDHVDQLFPVNSFGVAKLTPLCAHTLSTYLYLLDRASGGNSLSLRADCR